MPPDPEATTGPTAKQSAEPTQPFGQAVPFNLTIPPLETRLVDAGALEDYEIWVFWTSLLLSAFVGFLVAYIQSVEGNKPSSPTLIISIFLALMTLLAAVRVVLLRRRLNVTAIHYPMVAVAQQPRSGREDGKSAA